MAKCLNKSHIYINDVDLSKRAFQYEMSKAETGKNQRQIKEKKKIENSKEEDSKKEIFEPEFNRNEYEKTKKKNESKIIQMKTCNSFEQKNNSLIHINYTFEEEFQRIEQIVNTFLNDKELKMYTKDEILKVLNDNSFDIRNSYLQLKGTNFKDYSFNQYQDYIIKFMQNTQLYNELCYSKGKINVERRRKYLLSEK